MKNFLLIALIAYAINAKAQITLEHGYYKGGTGSTELQLQIVHLSAGGYKYLTVDTQNNILKLYSLNHTLYNTINVPSQPQPNNSWGVSFVSDELFNTNSSDIEYFVEGTTGTNTPPFVGYVRIYDELGNVLFTKDSVQLSAWFGITTNPGIFFTASGVKMILYNFPATSQVDSAYVYSLPGQLPCNDCTNGTMTGLVNPNGGSQNNFGVQNPYPNPTNNSTRIDYQLPDGVNQGEIVFYDLQGKELKRFRVDRTFDHLLISTSDIPAGTYFFQLQTTQQNSAGKKMVVIK